jgi:type IV secretory pathway protease TraF
MNKAAWFWATIAFLAIGWIWCLAHYRINDTPSVKEGLYRITYGPYQHGGYVLIGQMTKKLGALPGDHVRFTAEGIYCEGKLLPNTAPEPGEAHFPFGDMVIPKGMFIAVGTHPDSYDSRYEGPLPLSLIVSNLEPVEVK